MVLLTQSNKTINKIPNPFWILVIGALFTIVLNINGMIKFMKIEHKHKQEQEETINRIEINKRKKNIILFTIINVIIKITPILLLIIYNKYQLRIYDVIFTIGLFIVFFIYSSIINKKPTYWNKKYYKNYVEYGIDPTTPMISIINHMTD